MLRYRLEGNGAPLLLIHGWGMTYTIWQNLAPLLQPYFQLIMVELPGLGGSPEISPEQPYYPACAEALEELRQTLNIGQWSILAYSSGTRAAEAYLQRYAQYVNRAVFLCPIYLTEICSLGIRLLHDVYPFPTFTRWLFSKWRLYGLVRALGFNGLHHDYSRTWKNEIELQPTDILVRSLCDLPGRGRAPFNLPAVPTLFVWGSRDALTARPRRPRPNDVFIPTTHGAPMLAASSIAAVVVPFLAEGKLTSVTRRDDWGQRRFKSPLRGRTRIRSGAQLLNRTEQKARRLRRTPPGTRT